MITDVINQITVEGVISSEWEFVIRQKVIL